MQINVLCNMHQDDDGNKWYSPIDEWDAIHGFVGDTAYKAYHVNADRIVLGNPRTRAVFIDDGTADGLRFVLEPKSFKHVIDLFD